MGGSPLIFFIPQSLCLLCLVYNAVAIKFVPTLYLSIFGLSGTLFSYLSSSLFKNASIFSPVISLISPGMALNSLINFQPGLLSIIMEFLLFFLHFTREFFIFLCLALSFISIPINYHVSLSSSLQAV